MQSLSKPIRPLLALAALVATVVVASGCGTTSRRHRPRPRPLHRRSAASATRSRRRARRRQIGPEPRRRLRRGARSRRLGQRHDRRDRQGPGRVPAPRATATRRSRCRADIVEGQDLDDIAAYVGKYAGVPGAAPPEVAGGPGAQVFANNGCGGCHTLAAANSGGTTGPEPRRSPPRPDAKRRSKNRSSTRTPKSPRATRPT